MLIGIDASRATNPAPTGTETYSRELIRAMLTIDSKNLFRLYTREKVARDFFGLSSKCDIRAIPFPRLWTHIRLSVEMMTHAPDALWVPAHVLPLVHPRQSFVTVHDLGQVHFPQAHPSTQRAYHNGSIRWNAHAARHFFADSGATRDDLIEMFRIASERITVVYPAYDDQIYKPDCDPRALEQVRAKYRIGKDYVLAVGTIHPRKNYSRLIEAFGLLANECELIIIGKRGWLYKAIFDRARELRLESRVKFLDYVPTSELAVLLGGARLLAFPSLHEGFGLPVLEAQASGTPVVCSMTSSFPEVAGDGALFVDPLDVNAMAGAMERALSDENLRSKLILRGFKNVKRFSWHASARQILNVIEAMSEF